MMGEPVHSTNTTYISSDRKPSFEMDRLFMFARYGEAPAAPPKSIYPAPLGHSDTHFRGLRQSRCPSFDIVDCLAAAPNSILDDSIEIYTRGAEQHLDRRH